MKKVLIALLSVIILSGCGMFSRGNYEKNRGGFAIDGNLLINYHTNAIGEIDILMIDQVMSYFEALEYTSLDTSILSTHETISSVVTEQELSDCGVEYEGNIPKFIRIGHKTYFYNVRDNGYCTYDEYEFHDDGYQDGFVPDPEVVSPIENINVIRFKDADFTINTFQEILFIEDIYYNSVDDRWVKELVTALPMSIIQAGDVFEKNSDIIEELKVLENYVLENQSINLLSLREDYQSEDVNNIWSEETVDILGRDHELIKRVRLKNTGDILDLIEDTLGRLGMFQ